jgi:DNA primase
LLPVKTGRLGCVGQNAVKRALRVILLADVARAVPFNVNPNHEPVDEFITTAGQLRLPDRSACV